MVILKYYEIRSQEIFVTDVASFQVSFFLFIVFVVYTMLPFSMRGAIIASAITCFSHTITLSVCLASTDRELETLVWQVRRIHNVEPESTRTCCYLLFTQPPALGADLAEMTLLWPSNVGFWGPKWLLRSAVICTNLTSLSIWNCSGCSMHD